MNGYEGRIEQSYMAFKGSCGLKPSSTCHIKHNSEFMADVTQLENRIIAFLRFNCRKAPATEKLFRPDASGTMIRRDVPCLGWKTVVLRKN
jgi:hypothetical protein